MKQGKGLKKTKWERRFDEKFHIAYQSWDEGVKDKILAFFRPLIKDEDKGK